jgi:hypothetical protein
MTTSRQHKAAARRAGHPARRRSRKPLAHGGAGVDDPNHGFSAEEWHDMVSTAAYFRALGRGDGSGSADEDWYEAEAELRERFGAAESDVEGGSGPVVDPEAGFDPSADDSDIDTKGEQAWQT